MYDCLDKNSLFFNENANRRVCKNAVSRVVGTPYPSPEMQPVVVDQGQGLSSGDSIQNTETPQILPV